MASAPAAKRPRAAPALPALPDDVLREIFDRLPGATGRGGRCTAGGRFADARALAGACRRLDRYYREEYVTRLDLVPGGGWESGIARALRRYPRAVRLCVDARFRKRRFDVREALGGDVERAARIVSVDVPPGSTEGDVAALLELCPQLEEVSVAFGEEPGGGMRALVRGLPGSVSRLRLAGLTNSVVSDEDGARIGALRGLRSLKLDRCYGFGRATGAAVAGLEALECLSVSRCAGLDPCMPALLQGVTRLVKLALVRQAVTPRVLRALPAGLRELDLSSSDFIESTLPDAVFAGLTELRFLKIGFYLETWEPLRQVTPGLQTLVLPLCSQLTDFGAEAALSRLDALRNLIVVDDNDEGGSMITDSTISAIGRLPALVSLSLEASQVTDRGVARALAGMSRLRKLNLSGCERVGDAACEAIAPLALHSVDLSFTSVSIVGVQLLCDGACTRSVESLDLSSCPRIVDRTLAEENVMASFVRAHFALLFDFDDDEFLDENDADNEMDDADEDEDDPVFVLGEEHEDDEYAVDEEYVVEHEDDADLWM